MATTTLPADRVRAACERAASKLASATDTSAILSLLHLATAALSVNANATLTVSSDEFRLLAENW